MGDSLSLYNPAICYGLRSWFVFNIVICLFRFILRNILDVKIRKERREREKQERKKEVRREKKGERARTDRNEKRKEERTRGEET